MISEKQLSELFNHCGRLRMLSHRTGMLMTFISAHPTKSNDFVAELPITVEKFNDSYNKVKNAINDCADLTANIINHTRHQNSTYDAYTSTIMRYQQLSLKFHQQIKHKRALDEDELHDFLTFIASDLLLTLNSMVQFFENSLASVAEGKLKSMNTLAKEITDSLEEVDQINLSTKILSFNANVEAARAGELGKGFGVVSQEMTQLSSQTKSVSERIKRSVSAFVDTLNSALDR